MLIRSFLSFFFSLLLTYYSHPHFFLSSCLSVAQSLSLCNAHTFLSLCILEIALLISTFFTYLLREHVEITALFIQPRTPPKLFLQHMKVKHNNGIQIRWLTWPATNWPACSLSCCRMKRHPMSLEVLCLTWDDASTHLRICCCHQQFN